MKVKYTAGADIKPGDFLRIEGALLFPTTNRWAYIAQDGYEIGEEIEIEVDEQSEQAKRIG